MKLFSLLVASPCIVPENRKRFLHDVGAPLVVNTALALLLKAAQEINFPVALQET
jgi:hypothetical protein